MRCTLREYLSQPNQPVTVHEHASCSQPRYDNASARWPVVDRWRIWQDFDKDNVDCLFQHLFDTTFELADPPPFLDSLGELRRERGFELVLARNMVIVNEALRVACCHLGLDKVEWTVDENGTAKEIYPDWCGWTAEATSSNTNLIPGDSKFCRIHFPLQRLDNDNEVDSEGLPLSSPPNRKKSLVESCLQQGCYYATFYNTRYFYIITNMELLLYRRTLPVPSTSPIAQTKTPRILNLYPLTPTREQPSIPSSPPLPAASSAARQARYAITTAASNPFAALTSPSTPVSRLPPTFGMRVLR